MANLQYVRKNRIRKEMASLRARERRRVLAVGLPLLCVIASAYPGLAPLWGAGLVLALLATFRKDPVRESGAAGEEYTLGILSSLPDQYVIFNQLELPDERSRTGSREIDFVVCGPNGLFVVESKNHNGEIEGSEDDEMWTINKIGRGGTPYRDSIRNPVRQVKQQVQVLRKYLKSRQVTEWVNGIVALSSNNDLSGISVSTLPVVKSADVADAILGHKGVLRNMDGTASALATLASP